MFITKLQEETAMSCSVLNIGIWKDWTILSYQVNKKKENHELMNTIVNKQYGKKE